MALSKKWLWSALWIGGAALASAAIAALLWPEVWRAPSSTLGFSIAGRAVEILSPRSLMGLAALPWFVAVMARTRVDLPAWQRALNLVVRIVAASALIVALARPVLTTTDSRVSTIFLVDTSASVTDAWLERARAEVARAASARGERDDVQLVAFAASARPIELGEGGEIPVIERAQGDDALETDIAGALRSAYGLFPQDHIKRVVVLSDGATTRGDVVAEAHRAADYGVRLFTREIEAEARSEVLVRGVSAPQSIQVGEPFTLTARVFASRPTEARVTLWQNDFRQEGREVELEAGENTLEFEVEIPKPGFREFKLEVRPKGEDHFAENNDFVYSVNVSGKPRVLYLEGEQRARTYLQRALRAESFELETRSALGFPGTLAELANFDLVLMSDVAAPSLSSSQMRLLTQYVRELGGGFIMAGGESSFGPGGYKGSPIEELLPVKFEPKKERQTPSLALMLVIDKSGSMEGDRIALAKEAARAAVEVLGRNDKVGVIAFDDEPDILVRMQSAANRMRITSDIGRLGASGGTNIAGAMELAYEELALTSARLKHVIVLSDGHSDQANIFSDLLPAMRIERITVSSVAIGAESATSMLRRIAEGGGGRYYYTRDPYSVPRIFMKETNQVAKTSLVEEPFQARVVGRSQALRGIDWGRSPYLLGFVSTRAKPSAEVLLETETGEPLLARWRRGLGKSVAFTSDVKNRWGVEWVRWPGYAKFWAQLIRDTMRSDESETLAMTAEIEAGRAKLVVDAIDDEDRFINDLSSTLEIEGPGGSKRSGALRQTAPGRYEAELDLEAFGSYRIKARHERSGDTVAVSMATLSLPYPAEYASLGAQPETLRRAASIAGGGVDPEPAALFDPGGEEVRFRRQLWPRLVLAALAFLVGGLLLRRVRLGRAKALAWASATR